MISLTSIISLSFTLQPIFAYLLNTWSSNTTVQQIFNSNILIPGFGKAKRAILVVFSISISIVICWLVNGGWILNNFLALSLGILVISVLSFKNLKIAFILLLGLFLFDIFWVFFSSSIFGENVMVSVATRKGYNPINVVSHALNLPELANKQIELPVKLISLNSMLGLGDVVIPGLLASFAYRVDRKLSNLNFSHFKIILVGFSVGLYFAFASSHI